VVHRGTEKQHLAREPGKEARRWVVERVFSWVNRFRKLLVRYEKKAENYLGLLMFACAFICFRQIQVI
jgi:transposase